MQHWAYSLEINQDSGDHLKTIFNLKNFGRQNFGGKTTVKVYSNSLFQCWTIIFEQI